MNITSPPTSAINEPSDHHWLDSPLANAWIDLIVRITYWIAKFAMFFFCKSRRIDLVAADIKPGVRYVIAANHQSVLDPFLVTSQLPHGAWRRLRTLRYFLANYIFDKPYIRPLAVSIGAFPAKAHAQYPYGLAHAIRQLNHGRPIMIYPEGQRAIKGDPRTKRGITVLAAEPNVMIIPVHLDWQLKRFGRKYSIGIGKPFDGKGMTADKIMQLVYGVPLS